MTIRIIIADDHKIVREGLRNLLGQELEMEVIGEAETGRQAVQISKELHPDVAIIDIGMPDLNGIEATRRILSKSPHTKIIALSMHSDKRYIAGMLSAGASGYLLKDCAFEDLSTAVRVVMSEKLYLSPSVAHTVVKDYTEKISHQDSSPFAVLTNREREVLQLIAEGKATKEIASVLSVAVKTVETHRLHIMEKLGLSSIAELTKYAIREGLTEL